MLLTADQSPDQTYWISVGSQYRKGAPSAYGVLKYRGGSSSEPPAANIISPADVVDKKWTTDGEWVCRSHFATVLHDSKARHGPTRVQPELGLSSVCRWNFLKVQAGLIAVPGLCLLRQTIALLCWQGKLARVWQV